MGWYNEGTVKAVLGSAEVIGTSTSFTSQVSRNDILLLDWKLYEILSVDTDTKLTLKTASLVSGDTLSYSIIRNMTNASNADMMLKMEEFLTDRQTNLTEFTAWANGKYNQGPNGDGKYPLTDRYGVTTLVKCPNRMEYESQGGTGGSVNLGNVAMYSALDYGVVGGATVDESQNISNACKAAGAAGGGVVVVRSVNGTDPIYLNGFADIENSNVVMRFESPVLMGPNGGLRINGGLSETLRPGQTDAAALRINSTVDADGRMILPLRTGQGAFMRVGDRITIRGENDAGGKVKEKQVTTVIAINGDDLTCADEPDYSFRATYPSSAWEPDKTTGTTVSISVFVAMTGDVPSGTVSVPVTTTADLKVGDLMYISDSRTERDIMAPVVTNLLNAAVMEILRIAAIEGNNVVFERPLKRSYLAAYGAGMTRISPIKNSHIVLNSEVQWAGVQTSRKINAILVNYGDECTISCVDMNGKAGRIGMACRLAYSYRCRVIDSMIRDAFRFDSAEGYGVAIYYSTMCSTFNVKSTGNRHNFLVQTSVDTDILFCVSTDDRISGIDVHGAGAIDTRVMFNTVSRSKLYAPGITQGGGIRNGNTSHTVGDHGTIIEKNWISGYNQPNGAAIDVSPASQGVVVRNNDIVDSNIGVRHYRVGTGITPAQISKLLIVDSNTFTRVAQPLDLRNYENSIIQKLVLIGNKSVENDRHFEVTGIPDVVAIGNHVLAPKVAAGVYAFVMTNVAKLRAYQNYGGEAARGFSLVNVANAKVGRNLLGDVLEPTHKVDTDGAGVLVQFANDESSGSGDVTQEDLNLKVDKVDGKGLSTNDLTNSLKDLINDAVQSVTVGTVTTLAAGSPATVTNSGTDQAVVLNFGIPKGADGTGGGGGDIDFSIGTVTTLDPGQSAYVTDVGTGGAVVLNIGIPRGANGQTPLFEVGSVTTLPAGQQATVQDVGVDGNIKLNIGIPGGESGAAGKSTYQEWLDLGNIGDEEAFVDAQKGAPGDGATVVIGSVTTGAAGSQAAVTNSGTSKDAVLNFTIPRGDTGSGGGGTADYARPRALKTLALFGDSLSGNNSDLGRTYTRGFLTFALQMSGHRVYFDHTMNFGVGGEDSAAILARVNSVIAKAPDIVLLESGGNDTNRNIGADTTIANVKATVEALIAKGIQVILCTIYPTAGTTNPTHLSAVAKLNQWILDAKTRYNLVEVLDAYDVMFNNATGLVKVGYTYDTTHPAAFGSWHLGRKLSDILKQIVPIDRHLKLTSPYDIFNVTDFKQGNQFLNPKLTGTGGTTVATGASGTIPDNWVVNMTSARGATVTCAVVADENGFNVLEITLGGTTTSATPTYANHAHIWIGEVMGGTTAWNTTPQGVYLRDTAIYKGITLECEVENLVGVTAVGAEVFHLSSGGDKPSNGDGLLSTNTSNPSTTPGSLLYPTEVSPVKLTLHAEPDTHQGKSQGYRLGLHLSLFPGMAVSGKIRISRPIMRCYEAKLV